MELKNLKTVYFLGIGGIGMSALARYFKANGSIVCGYDKTPTPLTTELQNEGIDVHFDENISAIPSNTDLVIYTPAIPKDHKELIHILEIGLPIKKRAEVLGMITKQTTTIAIAGTHGKTTITSLVSHILKQSDKAITAFMGGISKNYDTNFLLSPNSDITVVEADEFDRSFLTLFPDVAIISSMDADHLDIYGSKEYLVESFELFAGQIKKGGKLILKKGLTIPENENFKIFYYSLNDVTADFYASNITLVEGKYHFELMHKNENCGTFNFGFPGLHNVENAVAAIASAITIGIDISKIKKAIASYIGVKRRFDKRVDLADVVYIDDNAHHPEELGACITSVRNIYQGKKITGIFQPHLFSRTRDFADEFAKSLNLLDELILLDIYPARELPIDGITSQMLLDKVTIENKILVSKEELIPEVLKRKLEVLLTLGAGDIDQLVMPIEKSITNIYKAIKGF